MKVLGLLALAVLASATPQGSRRRHQDLTSLPDRIELYPHLTRVADRARLAGRPGNKIVGGEVAEPHSRPYTVALAATSFQGSFFCTGSLINDRWVVTAAHCVADADSIEVTLGAHNLDRFEATQMVLDSPNFFAHENWKPFTVNNDIGLIMLPERITFNDNIQPINLATREPSVGTECWAAGWGKLRDASFSRASELHEVQVPVARDSQAQSVFGGLIDFDTKVCIDTKGGKGTCQGDSGGPLVDPAGNLVGITSFGPSAGCVSSYSCFTSVPSYFDWIVRHAE